MRGNHRGVVASIGYPLAAAALCSMAVAPAAAFADDASNAMPAKEKNETVYVFCSPDGSVKSAEVSASLVNGSGASELADSSNLTDIENVEGSQEYWGNGPNMVWEAAGEDVRYRGATSALAPVSMSVTYRYNGSVITPRELVGKSGHVSIRYDYVNESRQTIGVNGVSYDVYTPFTIATALLLDNDTWSNVEVTNGKVVDDGDCTIVLGYAMPGLAASLDVSPDDLNIPEYFEVEADVTDFELNQTLTMATAGLFDDIDVSDFDTGSLSGASSGLKGAAAQLADGGAQLTDGLKQLHEGSQQLADGSAELKEKTADLPEGVEQLYSGSGDLADGITAIAAGTQQLADGASELKSAVDEQVAPGAANVAAGAASLADGLASAQSTIGGLADENAGLPKAGADVASAGARIQAAGDDIGQALAAITANESLSDADKAALVALLGPSGAAGDLAAAGGDIAEAGAIMQAVDAAMAQMSPQFAAAVSGARDLADGSAGLSAGVGDLSAGVDQLASGASELNANMPAIVAGSSLIRDGLEQLNSNTGALVSGIARIVDGTAQLAAGSQSAAEGSQALSDGLRQFGDEGISKITDLIDNDVLGMTDRLQAVSDAGKSYNNFSGITSGTAGTVKFVYEVDSIEQGRL